MLFHFKTGNVTFFEDDQTYFEEKILNLKKFLRYADDENRDLIDVRVTLEKNRHHAGEKFECSITITCTKAGKFHAEVGAENIKKCADELYEKLKPQMQKYQETH